MYGIKKKENACEQYRTTFDSRKKCVTSGREEGALHHSGDGVEPLVKVGQGRGLEEHVAATVRPFVRIKPNIKYIQD